MNRQNSHDAPSISIIVPVYNVESYLTACLDSILNQTFTDFELILVDDGSTDRSGIICDQYAEVNDCIYVYHQINQGQSAARNFGVSKASANWIKFVDSDDVIHPQMLEFLYRAVCENNVLYSACEFFKCRDIPDCKNEQLSYLCHEVTIHEDELYNLCEHSNFYWNPYLSLVHRSIIEAHPFSVGKIYEDNAVCNQWIYSAGQIAVVDCTMYYYRYNPTSTVNQRFSMKKLDLLWALAQQLEFYDKLHYLKMLDVIFKKYVESALSISAQIANDLHDKHTARKILKKALYECRCYKSRIDDYSLKIMKIKKRLYPRWFRIKKAIRRRMMRFDSII